MSGFPIQQYGRIPWEVAEEAYRVYAAKYGTSQSLQRLAERGGFGVGEMDMFAPGWREKVEAVNLVKEKLRGVMAEVQRYQPGGSPPPGDERVLTSFVLSHLAEQVREQKERADRLQVTVNQLRKDFTELEGAAEDSCGYGFDEATLMRPEFVLDFARDALRRSL